MGVHVVKEIRPHYSKGPFRERGVDVELWRALLYRGLDFEGDVLKRPEYLKEAYQSGKELVQAIKDMR